MQVDTGGVDRSRRCLGTFENPADKAPFSGPAPESL